MTTPRVDLLLTGASGVLGAHAMILAMAQGRSVLGVVGRNDMPVPGRSVSVDLRDERAVAELVRDAAPKAIIHMAALTSPDACQERPEEAEAVNVAATKSLAEACFATGGHLVFVSTDLVFDGERGWYTEDDEPSPMNQYAATKARAEEIVLGVSSEFAVVRPSFLYGEPLAEHHVSYSHTLLQNLRSGTPTRVFHDQYRCPLPAYALAAALLEMTDERLGGIWHVAGPERVSRADFARTLAAVAGLDATPLEEISMDDVPVRAIRPRDASLNTTKARHRLQTALPCLTDGFHFLYGKGG